MRSAISGSNGPDALVPVVDAPRADLLSTIETTPLDRHPVAVYLAGLAAGSRRTQRGALRTMARMVGAADELSMPWASLDYAHTTAIRATLLGRYAPATGNRMLAALRGVLKAAFKIGLMSAEQMTRACSVEPIRGSRLPAGRSISQGELRVLFGDCDATTPGGARDAAMLSLLYAVGLRRAEVVGLDRENFDPATGAISVLGKGNKARRLFVTNGGLAAIKVWLGHRGGSPGPLLLPVLKGARIVHRRMSTEAIAERLHFLGARAKLQHFSAHDFRRTFVGDLLDGGADIATVQRAAGHASPATTSRYDRRADRAQQKAAGLLHVPFEAP